jgi:hypothetical protein
MASYTRGVKEGTPIPKKDLLELSFSRGLTHVRPARTERRLQSAKEKRQVKRRVNPVKTVAA